tara:strand:- start:46 stop:894 length:849 start_codon:yes stop_codon:yes gene_type:complete
MIIYSNGCSHTTKNHPYFKSYIDLVADTLMGTYDELSLGANINSINSLHDISDNVITDQDLLIRGAHHGKGNDTILFETYNCIKSLVSENIKIDYVVIQFSGVNRRIHTTPNGEYEFINLFTNSELGVKFEPVATEQSLQYMLILQDLFKSNNIKYCFIPYMEFDATVLKNSNITKLIDNDFLIRGLEVGCRNEFRSKGRTCDAPGHPNTLGYYELAKLVLEKFNLEEQLKPIDVYFEMKLVDFDMNHYMNGGDFIKDFGDVLCDGTDEDIEKYREIQDKKK